MTPKHVLTVRIAGNGPDDIMAMLRRLAVEAVPGISVLWGGKTVKCGVRWLTTGDLSAVAVGAELAGSATAIDMLGGLQEAIKSPTRRSQVQTAREALTAEYEALTEVLRADLEAVGAEFEELEPAPEPEEPAEELEPAPEPEEGGDQ